MNIHGALGAAGIRRVWAGAGLQRAAYRGGGILRGFPHSLLYHVIVPFNRMFACFSFLANSS